MGYHNHRLLPVHPDTTLDHLQHLQVLNSLTPRLVQATVLAAASDANHCAACHPKAQRTLRERVIREVVDHHRRCGLKMTLVDEILTDNPIRLCSEFKIIL